MAERERNRGQLTKPLTSVDVEKEQVSSAAAVTVRNTAQLDKPETPTQQIIYEASWTTIAIWGVLIALLVGFFALGSVTIYPRNGLPRTKPVRYVWALFRDDLPAIDHPALITLFFYVAIALFVIGFAWMLFLALGTRTVDVVNQSDEADWDSDTDLARS